MRNEKLPKKILKPVVVIIPTSIGGNRVLRCICSIKKLSYPQDKVKVVLIDNKTPDKTGEIVRKRFPWVKIIKNRENLGFAKAINQGIKKENADYFFVTNDDITFEKQSLKTLLEFAEQTPEIGICGGKQLFSSTKKFLAGGRNFNFLTGWQSNIKGITKPIFCDQIDGCTMLIKKGVIEKIGPFDEGFFPAYGEDLDYCLRAKKAGFKVAYYPKAIFFHEYASTTSTLPLKEIYYIGFKNKLRIVIKHANLTQLLTFVLFHYLLVLPYRLLVRKEPILLPEVKALIWNIKNINETLKKTTS